MIQPSTTTPDTHDPQPFAVLFDLDGTLVDSERGWLEAVRAFIESTGGTVTPEQLAGFEGMAVHEAGRTLRAHHGVTGTVADIAEALEAQAISAFTGSLRWLTGAQTTLNALRADGVPLGLVTSSTRKWVCAVEQHLQLGAFDTVVTADDVLRTKPHPDPYLRACEALGVAPGSCVAFEDSLIGARSAATAGCRVVQIGEPSVAMGQFTADRIPHPGGVNASWVRDLLERDAALSSPP